MESVLVNSFINAITIIKKLLCPSLKVDNRELKKAEFQTGIGNLEDGMVGDHILEMVEKEKYPSAALVHCRDGLSDWCIITPTSFYYILKEDKNS